MTQSAPRYLQLRSVPSTALRSGFRDRIIEIQNIATIERYPDIPSVALVCTFQGTAFITTHNFDKLSKEIGALRFEEGGARLEEKLLNFANERLTQQLEIEEERRLADEADKALDRRAVQLQLDADGVGEVITLDEARDRVEAEMAANIGGDSDADAGLQLVSGSDEETEEEFLADLGRLADDGGAVVVNDEDNGELKR